jgi:hypothetical protein
LASLVTRGSAKRKSPQPYNYLRMRVRFSLTTAIFAVGVF